MSVRDTTGVAGVACILARLAEGTPRTVAELAEIEGLARSTAFDLARRLQEAQLVTREPGGKLVAGPVVMTLAFARFGLARLHGPAEALLGWLRDHCGATTTLSCRDGDECVTLMKFCGAPAKSGAPDRSAPLSYPICTDDGREAAKLDVACRMGAARSERAQTERLALRVKASLEHHLREDAAP